MPNKQKKTWTNLLRSSFTKLEFAGLSACQLKIRIVQHTPGSCNTPPHRKTEVNKSGLLEEIQLSHKCVWGGGRVEGVKCAFHNVLQNKKEAAKEKKKKTNSSNPKQMVVGKAIKKVD